MADEATGLQGAADRIRETAKWITVSLAAIGTAALAGSQFSSVGSLDTDSARFLLAVAGSAAAGIAAVVALVATAWVATAPAVSLTRLSSGKPTGTDQATKDEALLGGFSTVGEMSAAYVSAVAAEREALDAYYQLPSDAGRELNAKAASARALAIYNVATPMVQVASYEVVAHRWRVAIGYLAFSALLGGAGLGVFVWSANPPEDAVASEAQANVLTTPTAKEASLTPEGITALGEKLGAGCKTDESIGLLVLGSTDAGPDVLIQQEDCASIRLVLTKRWGTVS